MYNDFVIIGPPHDPAKIKGMKTASDAFSKIANAKSFFVMTIVLEGDPFLFNQYGIMAVNPEKHPYVKFKEAMDFINWIISPEGQKAVMSFRDKHGNVLFYPNAK